MTLLLYDLVIIKGRFKKQAPSIDLNTTNISTVISVFSSVLIRGKLSY